MALKGNLKDISIDNIFQMIFLGKKGGKLSVTSRKESISIFFDEGKILLAEQEGMVDKEKLKKILLNNQYVSEEQWDMMVEDSERTFQSLWMLLSHYLENNIDVFLFLRQRHIEHALFNLLQWESGEYEYEPEEVPYLDKKVFRPIEGEFLLMEGYRVIDEWKKLESRLPQMGAKIFTSMEYERILNENGIHVDDNERYILSIIKQPISLIDLIDSSQIKICELGQSVDKLLSTGILTVLSDEKIPRFSGMTTHNWRKYAVAGSIFFCVCIGIFIREKYLIADFQPNKLLNKYQEFRTKEAMRNIAKSLKFYTSLTGKFPDSLKPLVENGYLSKKETLDPWGRQFILGKNSYYFAIFSQGPSHNDPEDDIYFDLENQFYHE